MRGKTAPHLLRIVDDGPVLGRVGEESLGQLFKESLLDDRLIDRPAPKWRKNEEEIIEEKEFSSWVNC